MPPPLDELCTALAAALAQPDQRTRLMEVLIAYAQHGDEHIDELGNVLLTHPDVEVRLGVANVLVMLSRPASVNALAQCVRTEADSRIRASALHALCSLGDERVTDIFHAVLHGDEALEMRIKAGKALVKLGDADAREWLISLLNDPAVPTKDQHAIIQLIADFRDERAIHALIHSPLANLAEAALEQLGVVALDDVLAAYHASAQPAWRIMELLSKIGPDDPRVFELLCQVLVTDGLEEGYKAGAAQFLSEIGTPAAMQAVDEWERNRRSS